jgi:uncharacterized membrane protein (DUF373 family)
MVKITVMSNLDIPAKEQALTPGAKKDSPQEDMLTWVADVACPLLVRVLTGLSIMVLSVWVLAGVINSASQLLQIVNRTWAAAAEQVIINALILLALLEVIRTLQSYLKLGRVRVTFILDTALVVLIGESMGLWFKEYDPEKVVLGIGVIVALVALRIITAKFSPESIQS